MPNTNTHGTWTLRPSGCPGWTTPHYRPFGFQTGHPHGVGSWYCMVHWKTTFLYELGGALHFRSLSVQTVEAGEPRLVPACLKSASPRPSMKLDRWVMGHGSGQRSGDGSKNGPLLKVPDRSGPSKTWSEVYLDRFCFGVPDPRTDVLSFSRRPSLEVVPGETGSFLQRLKNHRPHVYTRAPVWGG